MDINTHPYTQQLFKFFTHRDIITRDATEWIANNSGVLETVSNKLYSKWEGTYIRDEFGRVFYAVAYFQTEEDLLIFRLKFREFIAPAYAVNSIFNDL